MIDVIHDERKEETTEEKIAKLKNKLQKAIEEQEFEFAAQLRDEIKAFESEGENR